MGSEFAGNLLNAGFEIVAFDLEEQKIQRMIQKGATAAKSGADAARQADAVITSLPTAEAVDAAYLGDTGILAGATPGSLLIEMSTTTPSICERVHAIASERDIMYIDAPVIGLPFVARAAELVIMVGGSQEAFEQAAPILDHLGKELHYVGSVGDGQRAKLLNNMVLLTEYAISAEVFALAKAMGMDREKLHDIITGGMAGSETIDVKVRQALSGDFSTEDGFSIKMALKDLNYALDMGYEAEFTTPIAAIVDEHYTLAAMSGNSDKDYSVTMRVLEEIASDR